METQGSVKNVSSKLLEVVNAISGKVNKSGYNSFQKYKYVTEGDLIDAVREELVKKGLMVLTSVAQSQELPTMEGSDQRVTQVVLKHTIIDTTSGEQLDVYSAGQGADKLDKGVYKAITGANKYFLLKTFLLSGDDDPENDGSAKPAQGKPAQTSAKPVQGQGLFAKKSETKPVQQAAPSAAKPAFGAKAAKPEPQPEPEQDDDTPEAPTEEEDPGF